MPTLEELQVKVRALLENNNKFLSFSDINLNDYDLSDIIRVIEGLEYTVEGVGFSHQKLGNIIGQASLGTLTAFNPSFTFGAVLANVLSRPHQSVNILQSIFKSMPKNVIAIDLSDTQLHKAPSALADGFAGLQQSVKVIDLSKNELGRLDPILLNNAFQNLPKSLRSLNLSGNLLGGRTFNEFLAERPRQITYINVNPQPNVFDHQKWFNIFQALSHTELKELNLSSNDFNKVCSAALSYAISGLPKTVDTLKLGGNNLCAWSFQDLKEFLKNIPTNITTLDLSNNNFGKFTAAEIIELLTVIPSHTKSIILHGNNLFAKPKTIQDIDRVLKGLNQERKNDIYQQSRYDLRHNGESDRNRARGPLSQLVNQGLFRANQEPLDIPQDVSDLIQMKLSNV